MIVAVWKDADSWGGKIALPLPASPTELPSRMTLADAVKIFMALREGDKIAQATLNNYRTFTNQLVAFTESREYVMRDQFTRADMDSFYGGMKLGVRTKGKRLGTLRSFFRFCIDRKWLKENPVSSDLKPPKGQTGLPIRFLSRMTSLSASSKPAPRSVRSRGGAAAGLAVGMGRTSKTSSGFRAVRARESRMSACSA